MDYTKGNYRINDDREEIQLDIVESLLRSSYWAGDRSIDTIKLSIANSVCFSLFCGETQVGFARVVTDYASIAYIADLIIHADHRSQGLGTWLFGVIVNDPRWCSRFQLLATDDAHGLYEKFGFSGSDKLMSTKL